MERLESWGVGVHGEVGVGGVWVGFSQGVGEVRGVGVEGVGVGFGGVWVEGSSWDWGGWSWGGWSWGGRVRGVGVS